MDQVSKKIRILEHYLLFFYMGSLAGWLWELIVFWFSSAEKLSIIELFIEFRGVLHGPWTPIYGVGCVMICVLAQYIGKRPVVFFFISSTVCGIVEYVTSLYLELIYHARWWDYSDQFLNLNGRISALSVFFFGLAGVIVAFFLKPLFDKGIAHLSPKWKHAACLFATALFLFDCLYSLAAPNMGIGVDLIWR